MKNWKKISQAETGNIPQELRKKWGGDAGCPILDNDNKVLGWAASMPTKKGDVIEAITILGDIKTLSA